jgi:hypothetical protein
MIVNYLYPGISLINRLNISIANSYKINEPANNSHEFTSVLNYQGTRQVDAQ